ncbi:MAG: TlpA disulfide reductase family protein [Bryobacteraceae bacterium]
MKLRTSCLALVLLPALLHGGVITDVRAAIGQNNFALGENVVEQYRARDGVTPELAEAVSWLGRGALAAKQIDRADKYAADARKLVLEQLKKRALDAEMHLPLALGASIEVQAHVLAARGERGAAVSFLQDELKRYNGTSIATRIQKNIHLLSLEGKPAPPLDVATSLGPKAVPLDKLTGRPVLLFFWAHWCADCKRQGADIERLATTYGRKGLVVVGPTQHYGYVDGGRDATPQQETLYIDEVRKAFYSGIKNMAVPVSAANFQNYGSSSSPTLVLIDRKGIVRLYHPGAVPFTELEAKIRQVVQ